MALEPQVWSTRTWCAPCIAGICVHAMRRVVQIAEFDMQVIDKRLGLHPRRQPWRRAHHVPGKRLFDREHGNWPPLRLISGKQTRTGLAVDHEGELPGEIVSVVDAGIPAEAAVGWH